MNRNDCSIVQDLLPLYMEDMLRPDTTEYVADHLSGCENCSNLLAELKTETASPTPDAEEKNKGDQRELRELKKHLVLQSVALAAAFAYVLLHVSPWIVPQYEASTIPETIAYLFFTGLPVFFATKAVFSQKTYARNIALVYTIVTLPIAGLPLYLLLGNLYQCVLAFRNGRFPTGCYQHDTLQSLLYATIQPALLWAVFCGIILTGIVLYHIWTKAIPPSYKNSTLQRSLAWLSLVLTGCNLLLHFLPLIPYGKAEYTVAFVYLSRVGVPLFLTTAITFCDVKDRNEATFATMLALVLPVFAISPFGARFLPEFFYSFSWMRPENFAPLYCTLFLILSSLLSATAICSVWYKWKQHIKEELK